MRPADDVESVRNHTRLPLIAKIEKPQAVDAAEEIIRAADCVMVARGDLGIELPIEDVPVVQKRLLPWPASSPARRSPPPRCSTRWSPRRPTRAEATDVANAILDGTDAVMLSQETAVGAYPVEAVAMMASIAERTDFAPLQRWNESRVRATGTPPTPRLQRVRAARELDLAALVVPTLSGRSRAADLRTPSQSRSTRSRPAARRCAAAR